MFFANKSLLLFVQTDNFLIDSLPTDNNDCIPDVESENVPKYRNGKAVIVPVNSSGN